MVHIYQGTASQARTPSDVKENRKIALDHIPECKINSPRTTLTLGRREGSLEETKVIAHIGVVALAEARWEVLCLRPGMRDIVLRGLASRGVALGRDLCSERNQRLQTCNLQLAGA